MNFLDPCSFFHTEGKETINPLTTTAACTGRTLQKQHKENVKSRTNLELTFRYKNNLKFFFSAKHLCAQFLFSRRALKSLHLVLQETVSTANPCVVHSNSNLSSSGPYLLSTQQYTTNYDLHTTGEHLSEAKSPGSIKKQPLYSDTFRSSLTKSFQTQSLSGSLIIGAH